MSLHRLFRPLALASVLALCAMGSAAQAASCHAVEIRNVRPGQGTVNLSAFSDAAEFNLKRSAAVELRAGTADSVTLQVCGLTGDSVALMVIQDLNGNGKLDRNLLGLPIEPWGASANPSAMAAPTWDSTRIALDGGPIVINLSK